MTGERYGVLREPPEWWVVDYRHVGTPDFVINKYTNDSLQRAKQVAADLNEKDGSGG